MGIGSLSAFKLSSIYFKSAAATTICYGSGRLVQNVHRSYGKWKVCHASYVRFLRRHFGYVSSESFLSRPFPVRTVATLLSTRPARPLVQMNEAVTIYSLQCTIM